MSSDHQETRPPTATTTELHRQPSSSTPKSRPQTPSPVKPGISETTPESRLAAALGHAFFNIPPSSFPTNNTLLRTFSDADSSITTTTTTTTTPPKIPATTPLRRTLSETTTLSPDSEHMLTHTQTKKPVRRTLSDTGDYQLPHKTPKVSSSSPHSSTGKKTPRSEVMGRKIEEMVREIGERCLEEFMRQAEEEEETREKKEEKDGEECVGVERLKNGDLRFELSCSCGHRFQLLIKHNAYCFYRLT